MHSAIPQMLSTFFPRRCLCVGKLRQQRRISNLKQVRGLIKGARSPNFANLSQLNFETSSFIWIRASSRGITTTVPPMQEWKERRDATRLGGDHNSSSPLAHRSLSLPINASPKKTNGTHEKRGINPFFIRKTRRGICQVCCFINEDQRISSCAAVLCAVYRFFLCKLICALKWIMHLLNHTCQRYMRRSQRNNTHNAWKIRLLFTSAIESFAAFFFCFQLAPNMEEGMTDQQQQSISNTCVSSGKNKYCSCGKICLRNWLVRAHTSDCLVTNDCKKK